ncbi:hypothetical protein FOPG_19990 [Fusarium oxysporum f. sp. conglutinans race 2 54008]|uniref:Uncharacterized protein n=1 Tax=Fusarium oxysporum f. sp. conglutinans race 2 54008 TaxID=1089457 RepID=X0GJA5_FUSOX|nr:hypothetical protein FOPG_19990 [Fusarium oxysporum f. sp. conglutinans race 2 54008]
MLLTVLGCFFPSISCRKCRVIKLTGNSLGPKLGCSVKPIQVARPRRWKYHSHPSLRLLKLHILLTCRLAGRSRVQGPQASPPRRGQKHCEVMGWGGLFLALRDSKRYWHFRGARHLSLFIWTFHRRLRKQTRRDSEMQWLQQGIGGRRRSCRRRIQNNYKSSGMKGT